MNRLPTVLVTLALATAACSGSAAPASSVATSSGTAAPSSVPTSALSPTMNPLASPVIAGRFAVSDGRQLEIECWGEGSPTVVLEGGHPSAGISDFIGTRFVRILASETRTCAYSRAGYGASDPAPDEPRDADDVIGDLNDLLESAAVEGPYVLVGESFGGMIVTYYAARHPRDVVGVVLLDVPAPSADLSAADIPQIAWDHPENPEHLDIAPEFETRFANERLPIEAPITVITATGGDSDLENQSIWLEVSTNATLVELAGSHEIYLDDPGGSAAEVLKLVDAAR